MKTKQPVAPEVRKYFQEIGRRRGNALKAKHGSAYFKKMAAMRKTFGRQKKTPEETLVSSEISEEV